VTENQQQPSGPRPQWTPTSHPTSGPVLTHHEPAQPLQKQRTKLAQRPLALAAVALVMGVVGGGGAAAAAFAVAGTPDAGVTTSSHAALVQTAANSTTTDTEAVAKAVTPSVVLLKVEGQQESDEGSGIVLSSDGKILTNNHVVAAAASGGKIQVVTSTGTTYDATIVGRDPVTDLAVVQASGASGLTPASLGDSEKLEVGQPVVAIGAPLGLQSTVTTGIVSALDRPVSVTNDQGQASVTDAIQTDAAVNPGNSGGPLVNAQGQVIGINSSIASTGGSDGSQAGSIGLGFAIPITEAERVANDIVAGTPVGHGQLGVSVGDSTNPAGAKVGDVTADSAAAKAGLKTGDVITKVDDQVVDGADALVAAIRTQAPGTKVTLTYVSGGQTKTADVTLGTDQTTT
jgi:putative serine protease PepD